MFKFIVTLFIFALGLTAPLHSHAQDSPNVLTLPGGEVLLHISATESLDVSQDLLISTLRYEAEGQAPGTLQDEVNKAMKKALDMAAREKDVKAKTLQYNIHKTTIPRTKAQIWRASQGLEIRSENAASLLDLTGKLQALGFLSNGLRYTLSPQRAADIQDSMMEGALEKLQARATRAAKALGKGSATLIEVQVAGGGLPAPVSMYKGNYMAMSAMRTEAAPPVASAGETTLNLTVSAKALLKP